MILEELDEYNNTYLSAEPVIQDENGMWVVDENKAPYPLNSSMFPVMADFDTWVGQWNLQPVGDQHGEGFPIFDLNASGGCINLGRSEHSWSLCGGGHERNLCGSGTRDTGRERYLDGNCSG